VLGASCGRGGKEGGWGETGGQLHRIPPAMRQEDTHLLVVSFATWPPARTLYSGDARRGVWPMWKSLVMRVRAAKAACPATPQVGGGVGGRGRAGRGG